tara:strand:+ start:3173 stop:4327 length:1155 start_codon:yes stop_codon:yes gene_type:complete
MKKVCFITGSRAEYGLLRWLMDLINQNNKFTLQIVATGMHLVEEYGLTFKEIENDGFIINHKVEMLLASDTSSSISKSTGLGLCGFSDAYSILKPDVIIVLGDRYEIFSACIAAMFAKIPIAHIHGGEKTLGAYDESIRHAITKMSWWHFVATSEYEKRVIQLGENPERVFNVGGLGVDSIKKYKLLSKKELMDRTKIKFFEKNLLITYHPVTLEDNSSKKQFSNLLKALGELKNTKLIFTLPNADSNSKIIKNMIVDYVALNKKKSIFFSSLGQVNYYSLLQYVDGVIGNSSSGLLEVPTFKIGTINIGDRQAGRIKARSVIDCKATCSSIADAIEILYSEKFKKKLDRVKNPYGSGKASGKIIEILNNSKFKNNIKKEFYDL